MKTNKEKDYLEGLFHRLPEEALPTDFRIRIMQQVTEEADRVKKRNRRLSWVALILASIAILVLGILAIIYIGFPKITATISMDALKTVPFYIYIAFLSFLLLLGDHYFRKKYREKHKDNL